MQKVLPFTARCSSSRYFPIAANEPEVSHIHRKWLTSVLKNKVDNDAFVHFFANWTSRFAQFVVSFKKHKKSHMEAYQLDFEFLLK